MRKLIFAAAALAAVATPVYANETRVEARGGVIWDGSDSEATAGIALGYDFDLGSQAFVGAEVSGDKVLTDGTKVAFGFTGRLGTKIGAGKLYGAGGYTTEMCDLCDETWHLGAGYQHSFGQKLYGKVEYRHFFADSATDSDAVAVGLGLNF
jgi:hypothetical protein